MLRCADTGRRQFVWLQLQEERMTQSLSGRHFLKLLDFSSEEIVSLVDLAQDLKEKKHAGVLHKELEGKNIVLLFEKTSTRTRCSFEIAGHDLGMGVTYLDPAGSQMATRNLSKIPLAFLAACLMVSNTAAMARKLLKRWLNTQAFLFGMV